MCECGEWKTILKKLTLREQGSTLDTSRIKRKTKDEETAIYDRCCSRAMEQIKKPFPKIYNYFRENKISCDRIFNWLEKTSKLTHPYDSAKMIHDDWVRCKKTKSKGILKQEKTMKSEIWDFLMELYNDDTMESQEVPRELNRNKIGINAPLGGMAFKILFNRAIKQFGYDSTKFLSQNSGNFTMTTYGREKMEEILNEYHVLQEGDNVEFISKE